MTIMLNGSDLTVTQVVAAARHGEAVALAPEGFARAVRRHAPGGRHAGRQARPGQPVLHPRVKALS